MRPGACLLTGVSWLLAVLIPVLLMVATFGLERLEAALEAEDEEDPIADLVLRAPTAVRAHKPVPAAPHLAHTATGTYPKAALIDLAVFGDEPRLPTRLCHHDAGNTQFQPTRHANPV
jgi:hypothetical protein